MTEAYEFGQPQVPASSPPAAPPTPGPAAGAGTITLLDGLLADVDREVRDEQTTIFDVKRRPGFEVRYSTEIPYEQLAAWKAAAFDPQMPTGINELQVACAALASCCLGLIVNGEDVVDATGQPVTFADPDLQRRLGVNRPVDAVRVFYRSDGHVVASGQKLIQAAGYGTDAAPTRR